MSIQIKALRPTTVPQAEAPVPAEGDGGLNVIPGPASLEDPQDDDELYTLYQAPNDPQGKKAAMVRSIRLINTHSAPVKVTLFVYHEASPDSTTTLRQQRLLTPKNMSLPPNYLYVDDTEITLDPGDKVQGRVGLGNVVQYLISGAEREVI